MMTVEQLIAEAQEARENAFAPYSNFKVGAALLAATGTSLPRLQHRECQLWADDLRRARGLVESAV